MIKEFVLGFLLLPLSRDKGTAGQGNIFVLGQRDNGTSRPLETLAKIPNYLISIVTWVVGAVRVCCAIFF